MFDLIRRQYSTYYDTRLKRHERHWPRLFLFTFAALLLALSVKSFGGDITTLMVTGLTILTGFTFTALFSDHALAEAGLPPAKTENDIADITRLEALSSNFRTRTAYFITFAIVNVCILILSGIDTDILAVIMMFGRDIFGMPSKTANEISCAYGLVSSIFGRMLIFLSILLFLECLYTFYRLSETIISIVDLRRGYLKASRN